MGPGTNEMKDRSPEEIRHEMEQTRDRMSSTVDSIQHRLDPDRLKSRAKETLRENTIGRVENLADNAARSAKGATSDMFETIKKNPVPAALVAVGLGWLFMERRSGSHEYQNRFDRDMYGRDTSYYGMSGYPQGSGTREFRGTRGYDREGRYYGQQPGIREQFSQRAEHVGDKVSETAGNVGDKVSEAASNVGDTVSQAASNVKDTAANVADQAQWQARRAKSTFQQMMDDNPLLVGAAALAIGAAIGMALPETEKERELMGETRDQFVDKAQQKASETMDKVQQVAEKTFDTAKETAKQEAQQQNLTGNK